MTKWGIKDGVPDAVRAVPMSLEPELRLKKFFITIRGNCVSVPH